jgi:hypothetical protein
MKGGFGCSPCCGPTCEVCTRTCTEPHTGTAFEAVYTRFFEGVEVGNPSDGYLSASGDNDTSDPYNGMDGTGPWSQQVGGGFSDGGSYGGGTRFPCTYRFSFWRSSYTLGTATIPPASTALTENVITVTVSTGAVVFPDGRVITSADGAVTLTSVPLVSGGALAADPKTNDGTVSFALQCQNTETTFSVQARIEWNTQKRQHVLYGIVRECYEEGEPCGTACDGDPSPDVLYLTISNFTSNFNDIFGPLVGYSLIDSEINGTYVLERVAYFCDSYLGKFGDRCSINKTQLIALGPLFGSGLRFAYQFPNSGCFFPFIMRINYNDYSHPLCGPDYYETGTSTDVDYFANSGSLTGSFDWVLES